MTDTYGHPPEHSLSFNISNRGGAALLILSLASACAPAPSTLPSATPDVVETELDADSLVEIVPVEGEAGEGGSSEVPPEQGEDISAPVVAAMGKRTGPRHPFSAPRVSG